MRPLSVHRLPAVWAAKEPSAIWTCSRYFARLLLGAFGFDALSPTAATIKKNPGIVFISLLTAAPLLLRERFEPRRSRHACPKNLAILIAHTDDGTLGPPF